MELSDWGWNDHFESHYGPWKMRGLLPARVTREDRQRYRLEGASGTWKGRLAGSARHRMTGRGEYPTVGDWVVAKVDHQEATASIQAVLARRSSFSRKAVLAGGPAYGEGKTEEHVLAANIDSVFLISGLDGDHNVRRLERYLTVVGESGARPVIVLNKLDACADLARVVAEAEVLTPGVPVHAISALHGDGVDGLRSYLQRGQTLALLGSSGVGKSTLINTFLGSERLRVGKVREYDKRGRHTTTHRELIRLPGGAMLIDTPGLREIQSWAGEEEVAHTFADIEELIAQCRFRNCRHQTEPGCAVREAIEEGVLDPGRFRNYVRLRREAEVLDVRKEQRARIRGGIINKMHRRRP